MTKLPIVILFILSFHRIGAENRNLCSVRKTEKYCICKRVTDENQVSVVTEADCARINLQYFPKQEQLLEDLNFLELSHNEISRLDRNIVKFSSATLETLLLSYNHISYVTESFFADMPNLRKLVLNHNDITSLDEANIFENCKNLIYLDLSFNKIKEIHSNAFLPMTGLQVLDLSYNDFALGGLLTNTSNFMIENLKISPNISALKLDNLGLGDLHNLYFINYTNLKHLSLADNSFEEVPRVPYTVEYLDLSGSEISVLQAKHLSYHSLKTLKLQRMKKLESIHPYAFYNLQALEDLSIRNCPNLKEFNELIFGVLHKNLGFGLKRLTLSSNSLQTLNSTYKYLFRMLDHIDLTDNPWKCNCDLLWLQEFDNLYKSDYVKCSSPGRLTSKTVFDITDRDVPTCYPQKYGKKSHRVIITILAVLVIVLSALVAYLVYYWPNWYSNRRNLGPQSPYNVARTDEEL